MVATALFASLAHSKGYKVIETPARDLGNVATVCPLNCARAINTSPDIPPPLCHANFTFPHNSKPRAKNQGHGCTDAPPDCGSQRIAMPDTHPGQPIAQRLSCSGPRSSVPSKTSDLS